MHSYFFFCFGEYMHSYLNVCIRRRGGRVQIIIENDQLRHAQKHLIRPVLVLARLSTLVGFAPPCILIYGQHLSSNQISYLNQSGIAGHHAKIKKEKDFFGTNICQKEFRVWNHFPSYKNGFLEQVFWPLKNKRFFWLGTKKQELLLRRRYNIFFFS